MYGYRGYNNPPKPSDSRLEEASRNFENGILAGLRSKRIAPIYVGMDLDVWRYIVKDKGVPSLHKGFCMYQRSDFARLPLTQHWDYCFNAHSEGRAVDFPLKAKEVLSFTAEHYFSDKGTLKLAPKVPIEKVCIDFIKKACNIVNIHK